MQRESYELTGICMEVHRILGKGFLEIVYKDALEFEFNVQKIPFEREKKMKCPTKRSFFRINYMPILWCSTIFSLK